MKIRFTFFLVFLFLIIKNLLANEIKINSENIKILENGNIIKSIKTQANIEIKKLYLEGDRSEYNKKKNEIFLIGNVIFLDKIKSIRITAEEAEYNQINDVLKTIGKTEINIENQYEISSRNMVYNRKLQIIYSKSDTIVKDSEGNIYNIQKSFKYFIDKKIISASKVNVVDNKNNIYYFENSKIDLSSKEILGKELKIDFVDNYFGDSKNDPILKGRSALSNDKETKIYKTVFTTCNTENKSCPGWEIETDEFIHDKINKTFNYKNSWIKMFGKEIFYFPFFSHPDPSVKRKSGFLNPTYGSSNNYGSWINVPYFRAIDIDKDFTFKPRIYLDDKLILQSEYRQAFENSYFITDFSYNNDGKNTNSHFFAKSSGRTTNENSFNFQYQSVTNDEYLKLHNLSNSSEIINNESLLTSKYFLNNEIDEFTTFNTEFIVYEDLSKVDSDRFRYVFPSFNYYKKIDIDKSYMGNFYFNSSGFQQQYDTNIYETVITNDFLFNSDNFISNKGLKTNYQFLLKHDNSYIRTATYEDDETDLYQSALFKTEYPLIKESEKYKSYLKPIIAAKISPNNSKNIKNKNLRISYDNIFSFNRIGSSRNIEEGRSVSFGIEYDKNNKINNNTFNFAIANSLSDKKNNNLPIKSKLDQTRSDVVGRINFNFNEVLDLNYNFSYDRDFKHSNYQSISAGLEFSNFSTSFNYLSEDNLLGDTETINNTTNIYLNNENSLKFTSTKNLKTDFTEYYNLNYEYKTDCLIASVEYKKKFYKDGSILPDKSLLFYLRFIPFAELRPEATEFK